MISWIVWFFLSLPLFLLDGWLSLVVSPVPCLTLGFCLFAALEARPSALPGLLVGAALSRSVLVGGDAALHVLILGVPVSVLVPLRTVFYRRRWVWQGVASAFLALTVPKATAFFGQFADAVPAVAPVSLGQVLWACALVPPAAWFLRGVPPLSVFGERVE